MLNSDGLRAAPQTGQRLFVARSASFTDLNIRMVWITEPHLLQTTSAVIMYETYVKELK
jgi:hypothetical protein